MKNTANVLIVTGGIIILTPFAYLYFTYRLTSHALYAAIEQGQLDYKVNLKPVLPEYYIPICLMLGVACLATGVFFAWRGHKQNPFELTR
jgi:cytochrome bd-type quinol oxidase subunit 2